MKEDMFLLHYINTSSGKSSQWMFHRPRNENLNLLVRIKFLILFYI